MATPSARLLVLAGIAATIATAAIGAAPAAAGVYTAHTCRTPDGAPASTAEWKVDAKRTTSGGIANACAAGGPLTLQLRANAGHQPDDSVSLRLRPPADTALRGYVIYRSLQLGSRYNYSGWSLGEGAAEKCHNASSPCRTLGDPTRPFSQANLLQASDRSDLTGVQLQLTCGESDTGSTWCKSANPAAALQLHRAELTLEDDHPPRFSAAPSGPLAESGGSLSGAQWAMVSASDRGGGVYRALLEVDGRVVASRVLDDNDGRCSEPFTALKPCPGEATRTLWLDTAQLSDGEHLLRIVITDATSTNAAAWGPVRITTDNAKGSPSGPPLTPGPPSPPPPPSGDDCRPSPRATGLQLAGGFAAPRGGRRRSTRLLTTVTSRHGGPLRLRGRLTRPGGTPVAGARVCLAGRPAGGDGRLTTYATAETGARGVFALTLPAGPSRDVYLVHRLGNGAVVRRLRTRVPARLSLQPSSRRVRNGHRLLLRGRLRHRPTSRRGVLVELQARRGSSWQTFGTTRAGRDGSYRFAYRFTRTTSPSRYALRALVAAQAGYPYDRGASRPIRVTVSPR